MTNFNNKPYIDDFYLAKLIQVKEDCSCVLRRQFKAEEMFLDMFEHEYQDMNVSHLLIFLFLIIWVIIIIIQWKVSSVAFRNAHAWLVHSANTHKHALEWHRVWPAISLRRYGKTQAIDTCVLSASQSLPLFDFWGWVSTTTHQTRTFGPRERHFGFEWVFFMFH